MLKTKNNKRLVSSLALTTTLLLSSANAQVADNSTDAAIVTYDAAYFTQYAPVTLLDMLQRVPGVPEILNKNRQQNRGGGGNNRAERGFGSGGDQILMDGKRLAGKSNNINDTLGRISADQVEKVELIRGATSGLDVQSQGLVVNIVLKEGLSTSSTFWQVKSETKQGHSPGVEALVSHSGSKDNLDYVFSMQRTQNKGYFTRNEQFYTPLDLQTGNKLVDTSFYNTAYKLNSNLSYNFEDGAVLRLNGLFEKQDIKVDDDRIETGDDPNNIFWAKDEDKKNWEFGGDYTRNIATLGRFKALFVINRKKENQFVDRSQDIDTSPFIYSTEEEHQIKQEKILRVSVTNTSFKKQTIEIGGEAAINTFNKKFDSLDRDLAIDPFVVVAEDNVEIQENRYEVFINHSYNFSPSLVLQSSITTEFSNIVADNIFANGDIDTRDTKFTYFKPRINLRYDVTARDQMRLTVEKKVSQLNFNNFVTRFDQRTEEFKFGNTNIRPEQIWEFLAAYEHRFPNDGGSIEFEGFYRNYTDKITRVDFTNYVDFGFNSIDADAFFALPPDQALRDYVDDTGDSYTAKSGNIDSAKTYGIKVKGNVRLGFIGLPQAVFSANYTYEKSDVQDDFTRLSRRFQGQSEHMWDINYRHDMTDIGLSYGGRLTFRSDGASHDLSYNWSFNPQANLMLFAEYNIMAGVKLRVEAKQLTGKRGLSTQYYYSDHIRFNNLTERVEKQTTVPREVEISLSGTF